ncbi:MAG: hypothetical protein ABSF52_07360 [Syntrophobacteraceae bacterium]|jgi:hypothetical protein
MPLFMPASRVGGVWGSLIEVFEPQQNNSSKKEKIMAVVRSLEGTFYDIPEGELEKYKVPADQVKGLMEAAGQKLPQNPGQQPAGGVQPRGTCGQPQILVQFITQAPGGAPPQGLAQGQGPPAEGEEKVEPQWYWINWANWANWYNWY